MTKTRELFPGFLAPKQKKTERPKGQGQRGEEIQLL